MNHAPFQSLNESVLDRLQALVGAEHISVSEADLAQYAGDMSGHEPCRAEAVVWPGTAEEVAAILKLASEQRVPVTAWGAGTSLEGNPIPVHGGILLSMHRMQAIIAIHDADFQVTVQPGIGYKDMNSQLARYGLFFAPDPGANATIGGMLANNAAGIRTVKYGACKDNVLRIQVALPDGRLIHCGSRSVKQASGYDLLHLFVGSEGTLGVITEATLKLAPIARHASAVVANFPTVEAAVEAVVAVRGSGLGPAALEFIDAHHARMLSQSGDVNLGALPVLFMEFHAANRKVLEMDLDLVREICAECDALDVRATSAPAERRRLWHARHHAYENALRNHPGESFVIVDVVVPISHYPQLVAHVERTLEKHSKTGYMIGHAGDGNLHVLLPFSDKDSYQDALGLNQSIVEKALALDGTATGEHGVGIGKARYMSQEHGAALDVMRSLKQLLDPAGIMNPGKIFP
ncbi:MAG TPA: FAD-binding oxidoreductase [Candidatus Binatia bacterium]|nr:FAD-binding oxidoreductase [Candidatus Binatia bacterium]